MLKIHKRVSIIINILIMKNVFFLILFSLILFTSCISTRESAQSMPVFAPNVTMDPLKVEVDVKTSEKLIGNASFTHFLFWNFGDTKFADGVNYSTNYRPKLNPFTIFTFGKEIKIRSAAACNAMKNTEADIIVNPQYIVTKKNFIIFSIYESKVEGYAGYFNNFYHEKENKDKNIDFKFDVNASEENK